MADEAIMITLPGALPLRRKKNFRFPLKPTAGLNGPPEVFAHPTQANGGLEWATQFLPYPTQANSGLE
jgi:hypothetical protein